MRRRLEKPDRDRVRDRLTGLGCRYVRINHGTRYSNSRPDLEGVTQDLKFFGIEMKAEDIVLTYPNITAKQDEDLREIALAGGRSCAARLQRDGKAILVEFVAYIVTRVGVCDSVTTLSFTLPLDEFCIAILTGKGWP